MLSETGLSPTSRNHLYLGPMDFSSDTLETGLTMREMVFVAPKIHSTMKMMGGSCSHCVSVGDNEHLIGSLADSNVT